MYKYSKLISVSSVLVIFLAGAISTTHASVDMKELQARFKNETGVEWSKASSELRSDFMYQLRGVEKKEEREGRVRGVVTPFHIREGYRKVYKMDWDDADEEDQESFLEEYKSLKKQWDKEEEDKIKAEAYRLKQIAKEKHEKKKERYKKKKEKAKLAKEKQKALDQKKKETKKKLMEAKKRKTKLHEKLGRMRR